ncbi:hypothetical protein AB0C50_28795 [Micromonospora taraxaci]|uniref:hypothetical protein n=1 Tax=Micromonospora taraxaci TaxID=1316803 RepID=UPI0033E88384
MSDPQHRSGPRAPFWESMVGMLTAIAGLVTAIVGVAAFVYQVGGFGAADGPQGAAAPSAAPSSAGPVGVPTTPTDAGSVQGAGAGPHELLFNNNGADLDADPTDCGDGPGPEHRHLRQRQLDTQLSGLVGPGEVGSIRHAATAGLPFVAQQLRDDRLHIRQGESVLRPHAR